MGIIALIFTILLSVATYLFYTNHKFKYYVKFTSYYTLCIATAVVYIPYFLFKPLDVSNLSVVGNFYGVVLRIFGLNIFIRGHENLQSEKQAVIMLNHQASLDLIPMMQALPERSSALAKKELLYMGPFGLGAWLCGLVFVDRNNKKNARKTMDLAVERIKNERIKLWVFPEGTRHLGDTFLPFKKGGFHLALQTQAPIMPIVVSSYRHFLCTKQKIFNDGKVIVTCLPPIPTEGLTENDIDDLMERVRATMLKVFEETTWDVQKEAELQGVSILPPLKEENNPYTKKEGKGVTEEELEVEDIGADTETNTITEEAAKA